MAHNIQPGWLTRLKKEGGTKGLHTIGSSALGVGVGLLGLPILTIGLFMGALHNAFGWTRAEIAGASACINIGTILAAPVAGRLCDKIGVRPVALVSLCFLAVGFACLAEMNGKLMIYYLIWLLLAAGGVGTSGIVWTRAIGTYYRTNRGLALGLALTGTAFAASSRRSQRLFSIVGLSMLVGRILIGRMLDKLDPLIVATVALAIPSARCMVLLAASPSIATFAVAATLFGFSAGAEVDILPFMVARYFGLQSYGAIYGTLLVFFAAGSGTGGILTGHIRDVSGTYHPAQVGGIVVFLLGTALVGFMGSPSLSRRF